MAIEIPIIVGRQRRRRSVRLGDESATFVVSSASGAAVPVSQPMDLKELGPILSKERLKEVREARSKANVAPATQA
jgi:hypothetical protein